MAYCSLAEQRRAFKCKAREMKQKARRRKLYTGRWVFSSFHVPNLLVSSRSFRSVQVAKEKERVLILQRATGSTLDGSVCLAF